jgi:hypothetical protein
MNPNGYPFTTRLQILERIESDPAFAAECVAILQVRYERRDTGGLSMGWMASHAVKATALAARLVSGEATEKDRAEASKLAVRYSKQLARVFRERELASRPELGAQAAVFGVGGVVREAEPAPNSPPPPAETTDPTPATKKRGRPKGSKNKPRQEAASKRRRTRG